MNFKEIHIGSLIKKLVAESGIEISRICNFLNCIDTEVEEMYSLNSLNTELLLKWSKLLEYDFFRIYSQHLILYAPPSAIKKPENQKSTKTLLPSFRKNIYTQEVINFILEKIAKNEMTINEVIERYRIPKSTLYKWISKYQSSEN